MTGQPRNIQTILAARLAVIQSISEANSETLRLNQIASGMMILDQKDAEDGADVAPGAAERAAVDAAFETCRARIETLEAALAELDRELKAATERKPE